MNTIRFVDSHTGGEPTRTIIEGGPELGAGDMRQRRDRLEAEHDWLRSSVIHEPRGYDWLVGALLQEPVDSRNAAGVIFFNNVGYLGMCGHGLIGVVETLRFLGRLDEGVHRLETPVGVVEAKLSADGSVAIENVASYRHRAQVVVDLADGSQVVGDIAYGGNWFFLTEVDCIRNEQLDELMARAKIIRAALLAQQITGADGAEIDHVELFGPASSNEIADSRNFVLCPGGQFDRSPCGTGTSAKVACLAADGKLAPGQNWRQESIVGSVFTATYRIWEEQVLPTIEGRAFVTSHGNFVLDEADPFRVGVAFTDSPRDERADP